MRFSTYMEARRARRGVQRRAEGVRRTKTSKRRRRSEEDLSGGVRRKSVED
jgi:hypothetical protein